MEACPLSILAHAAFLVSFDDASLYYGYPSPVAVCAQCFAFFSSERESARHAWSCAVRCPPGDEVYRRVEVRSGAPHTRRCDRAHGARSTITAPPPTYRTVRQVRVAVRL